MRITTVLIAVQILIASGTAFASNITEEKEHQNKNKNIIAISQEGVTNPFLEGGERKELSQGVFSFKTIQKSEEEKHNEKRLSYYKGRLEGYVPPKGEIKILVTGYSSTPDQTWGDPFTTASGTRVHLGTMACPPQYPFGTKIRIEGRGTYVCEDRGGAIKGNHFDMWFESRIEALQWGKRTVVATIEK